LVAYEVLLHGGTEEVPVGCVMTIAGTTYTCEIAGENWLLECVYSVRDAFKVVEDGDIAGNRCTESTQKSI